MADDLSWQRWWQRRCRAVTDGNGGPYWGRCELRRGHDGLHALERGMETPCWSTEWVLPLPPTQGGADLPNDPADLLDPEERRATSERLARIADTRYRAEYYPDAPTQGGVE